MIGVLQVARSPAVVWEIVGSLVLVLVPSASPLLLSAVGGLYMSRRAMRPIQDAFERQRTFIADASHELKTPLTLIRADAEVSPQPSPTPTTVRLADDLISETDRMNALLSDLLTLARLDAGKLSVERKPFDLANTIAETAERFDARAAAEGKRLEVRLDPADGIPARGDAGRTEQMLASLLDNALRFTPPGGLVTVEGHPQDGQALATVTDTGPGIPPEHLPRVFDRFYRAEAARTRSDAGGGQASASPSPATSPAPRAATSQPPTRDQTEPAEPASHPHAPRRFLIPTSADRRLAIFARYLTLATE